MWAVKPYHWLWPWAIFKDHVSYWKSSLILHLEYLSWGFPYVTWTVCNTVNRPTYIFISVCTYVLALALLSCWLWSPLIEAGSSNLALLHCSCSGYYVHHYKTMACDVTVEKPISRGLINMEAFWREAFSKKLRKTTREVVSTSKVWSSTSKETGNRQEVCSSLREVMRRFMGLSSSTGGWRLQRSTSAMVNGDCSTYTLCQHPAYRTGW